MMVEDLLKDGSGVREEGVVLRSRLPAEYLRFRILQPLAHLRRRSQELIGRNQPVRCSSMRFVHASLAPLLPGGGARGWGNSVESGICCQLMQSWLRGKRGVRPFRICGCAKAARARGIYV